MSGEVATLVGYSVGRIGLFKVLKWIGAFVCVGAGVAGFAGSKNAGQFLISVLLVATPVVWFVVRRKIRAAKVRKLYLEAVAEVQQEWRFTQNEQAARAQTAEIARAVKMTPEEVWADVIAAG